MHLRLKEILAEKRREVKMLREGGPGAYEDTLPPLRDFGGAVSTPGRVGLIAEIKFASPSAGTICKAADPVPIGRIYEKSGAAAISLLTDKRFFRGDLNQLPRLKRAVRLPVLRKDFIIDPLQLEESSIYGADAVLLIARILSRDRLRELLAACREFGLAPLTEVHDREDLEKAIECGARIIGINNRDLDTFKVDIHTTLDLAGLIPDKYTVVSESGIRDARDVRLLNKTGINAVLVGSSIMKSNNMAAKVGELVEAGKDTHGKGQNLRYNKS